MICWPRGDRIMLYSNFRPVAQPVCEFLEGGWVNLTLYIFMRVRMLSCFSRVWLFVTLWTVAHQALLSMGFSRQEYWTGFPCPPPGGLPNPGIAPRSPTLKEDSLPSEPPGNTGVGSLALLQGIFLTQELTWDLLNCRWILYQLSYQRSLSWVLLLPKPTAFMLAPLE